MRKTKPLGIGTLPAASNHIEGTFDMPKEMSAPKTVCPQYLKERMDYNPETGLMFWKAHHSMPKQWNTRYAGREAFTAATVNGYKQGQVDNVTLYAHRVAYTLAYGEWPTDQIDHINGVRTDNRAVNLRIVSAHENRRNAARMAKNTSGVNGVNFHKASGKWRAFISKRHIGLFATMEDAVAARKHAERVDGFHDNHGRAAIA